MLEEDPVLVDSGLSQDIEVDGYLFEIMIYRLEEDTAWTLEVVDENNASHVWDDTFPAEFAALVEAQKTIRTLGAEAFMTDDPSPTLH